MNILLLGANHASTMNSLKIGLDKAGVNCKALSLDLFRANYNNYDNIDCIIPNYVANKSAICKAFLWRFYLIFGIIGYIKKLVWADVVIYYSKPTFNLFRTKYLKFSIEIWLINFFVKKKYVWFTGSDIRDPEIELLINPFFKFAWGSADYEYKDYESTENSFCTQLIFSKYKFKAIVWEQYPFILSKLFNSYHIIPHASISKVSKLVIKKNKIKIVHAPSAPYAKGTFYVERALNKLLETRNDFEFVLLKNLSNNDYQKKLNEADILIDQLIWGAYGVAAYQALQSGKVVVAYLLETRVNDIYGQDCPIVNANIDSLYDVIKELLDNENLDFIKEKGKNYYAKMHAPLVVANKLLATLH